MTDRIPPSHFRRRVLRALLGAAALPAPFAALAGFNFFTNEYTATREELQSQIAKRFPVAERYAEIFMVGLRDPQLGLDGRANRAAITATLTIASPLLAASPVQGVVSVSSALRYDAAARALRLDQPKAERLELQGVEGRDAERLQKVGAVVAQELLQGQILRSFTADELTVGRKTYEVGDITVQDNGIKVQLK
ncbi:hypothetical protein D3C87_669110 [compost metagenome]|uniref:DUF1439 domain-containing protein n=1 Tax=Variovorax boronicumulans TaxID=436515 RepID=A0AAW8E1M1_9BURK|nr:MULTISPECIES: DUF1439 domain-containing protein [Variovorax]MDP9880427.1 hypothetical protein [Variovorax boronicumulans]MDP9912695.1 hypothetical protein [Variovorax boronicumulans]MDP9918668.1 hypothetical protein [Variovorax boronicumulans]MDP9925713.1 hypothetical protein [Variovorax boronicumulans]TSD59400.1 DUF1439 domain-containing protein [Variovorax sp. KBS0712]